MTYDSEETFGRTYFKVFITKHLWWISYKNIKACKINVQR